MSVVTPTGTPDALFDEPYVDIDEWRDEPIRHRYVHGGFENTNARFALHFPVAERYEGRFFQPIFAVPGSEHMSSGESLGGFGGGSIEFALASGGYLVESNQGSLNAFSADDWTVTGYRTSAAVARYSRHVAADMYGTHRPYGYVFGGSGGSYKTMSCFENFPGLWDGAVPYVTGTPMSVPNMFTVQNLAMEVLRGKFPMIVDAIEPGGSGDMYASLSAEERTILAEVTRMGFPPRAWFDVDRIASHFHGVWALLVDNVMRWDPQYFDDFWTLPGYLGANPPDWLTRARVQHKATVTKLVTAAEADSMRIPLPRLQGIGADSGRAAAFYVDNLPEGSLQGATVTITSGKAQGQVLSIVDTIGGLVVPSFGQDHPNGLQGLAPGDEVLIDNATYLASLTYHRHQVHPDFPQWDQFQAAGQPIYPQRPKLMGPRSVRWNCGSVQTGRFAGKMIVVQTLMDEAAYPANADYYRRLASTALSSQLDENYRLWFIDHAMHGEPMADVNDSLARTTHIVGYRGVIQQALRDLAVWVEKGLAPPPSTEYALNDCQVVVPATAAERRGLQPVVDLSVNGGVRAEVSAGQSVEFYAVAEVPAGAGAIVGAEWDFEGTGEFPVKTPGLDGDLSRIALRTSHAFDAPGTYFPVVRITSQRQGDARTPFGRIQNLGRVRVVVV